MLTTTKRCLKSLAEESQAQGQSEEPSSPQWYALYTRSHCEELVYNQLVAKGFDAFLPKIEAWARRTGQQRLISTPLFPSYLFLRHAMDKMSYVEVHKARGLVRILGERWQRLSAIPASEIDAIQKALRAHLPLLPYSYLKMGQCVRVERGPLAGVEGILMRSNLTRGILVLSIDLLQRSVAVEVDCSVVFAV